MSGGLAPPDNAGVWAALQCRNFYTLPAVLCFSGFWVENYIPLAGIYVSFIFLSSCNEVAFLYFFISCFFINKTCAAHGNQAGNSCRSSFVAGLWRALYVSKLIGCCREDVLAVASLNNFLFVYEIFFFALLYVLHTRWYS